MQRSTITADRVVLPPEQLDRKLYTKVNKVLAAVGGKWDRKAGAHLFQHDPREALGLAAESGKVTHRKNALQAFYTPRDLAQRVAEVADPQPGERVLEPSCGHGALIWALLEREPDLLVIAFDIDPDACAAVEANADEGHGASELPVIVAERDFLTVEPAPEPTIDLVVMNPPFAKDKDIAHVRHAWEFVKPGGRLVSIMSTGWCQSDNRRGVRRRFAEFVDDLAGHVEGLGHGAFEASGTSVGTVLLTLHKPA
ncbi:MAG TPA: methyltransferase [Enhygromyxa sp.]|nr:methyltransferase [Enhygromyxa sp.]